LRFFVGVIILLIVCLLGLFLYGQALEPQTRQIELEISPKVGE